MFLLIIILFLLCALCCFTEVLALLLIVAYVILAGLTWALVAFVRWLALLYRILTTPPAKP